MADMDIVEIETPTLIEGFKCYAPESASINTDFPEQAFDQLFELEARSFWFRGRQRIIEQMLSRFLHHKKSLFLEVGCGTGFVLRGLQKYKNLWLMGAELHLEGLKRAKARVPSIELIQLDATKIPFRDAFDAIGAFDVVEHIEADDLVFRQMGAALKAHGFLFLTVPQHMWLWSDRDVKSFHKRRYSRQELDDKLRQAGFKVRFVSSFITLLLPALAFSRLQRDPQRVPGAGHSCELALPVWVDRLFELTLLVEWMLIRLGFRLPMGGSLIVAAQKQ